MNRLLLDCSAFSFKDNVQKGVDISNIVSSAGSRRKEDSPGQGGVFRENDPGFVDSDEVPPLE